MHLLLRLTKLCQRVLRCLLTSEKLTLNHNATIIQQHFLDLGVLLSGGYNTCRIIVSALVPFLWTLDLGFGTWIWYLELGLGLGLTIIN